MFLKGKLWEILLFQHSTAIPLVVQNSVKLDIQSLFRKLTNDQIFHIIWWRIKMALKMTDKTQTLKMCTEASFNVCDETKGIVTLK